MADSVERGPQGVDGLAHIPRWTRRYAQSRFLPVLIPLIACAVICYSIDYALRLGEMGHQSGSMLWSSVWIFVFICASGALVVFVLSRRVHKWLASVSIRYYAKEGHVALTPKITKTNTMFLGVAAISCWFGLGLVILHLLGYGIPTQYARPLGLAIGPLYLVFSAFCVAHGLRLILLLWAFLIALHEMLAFFGVLPQSPVSLQVLVPGILAALIGHGYNRFALRKLKRLAHIGIEGHVEGEEARA